MHDAHPPGAADLSPALSRLAGHFERFALEGCPEAPVYVALSQIAAQQPEVLALLLAAPETQQRANLLLAAVHERLLRDADEGRPPEPLAAWFASVGGDREVDAELAGHFLNFVRRHGAALRSSMAAGRTQTNEIGRCAVLWPALAAVAQRRGTARLALFDFGCSAGLNLEVDRYGYRYQGDGAGLERLAAEPAAPTLDCRWIGAAPPRSLWSTPWQIEQRAGVDLAPVDLNDPAALRWLRACVWPSDTVRMQRLQQAAALAGPSRRALYRSDDGLHELATWLEQLPAGVTPVVFNSWVLAYFTPAALAAHGERLRDLLRVRDGFWLSAEDAPRTAAVTGQAPPADLPALPADSGTEPASVTWWALLEPGRADGASTLLARSHPHGRWLHWLADG